jgi:hypothetical protein
LESAGSGVVDGVVAATYSTAVAAAPWLWRDGAEDGGAGIGGSAGEGEQRCGIGGRATQRDGGTGGRADARVWRADRGRVASEGLTRGEAWRHFSLMFTLFRSRHEGPVSMMLLLLSFKMVILRI